jgi:cytochrome c oxidase subunit 1
MGLFAGMYYWLGKMSGRQYPEILGKIHFWMMFVGVNITFFPQHFLGFQGMPRRYMDYSEAFAGWNFISSIGALIYTIRAGKRVEANYWGHGADTLEWTLPSPPPAHTFETLPVISDEPIKYHDYTVAGKETDLIPDGK